MFRKRNVVYLFVLLALTMTLTGCFGSKEQSIDDFLKEFSEAYASLNVDRVMNLIYIPNVEGSELIKKGMAEELEEEFKIYRLMEAEYIHEIKPAKGKDTITFNKNEGVIHKGIIKEKIVFNFEFVENLIDKEEDLEILEELEWYLSASTDGVLLDEEITFGDDDESDIPPIHLKRVGEKWKIDMFYEWELEF